MLSASTVFLLLMPLIFTSCQVKEAAPVGDLISHHTPVTNKFTISTPTAHTYIVGETVTFILNFPFDVEIDNTAGDPLLELDIGGISHNAALVPQANLKQLHFSYVITPGEEDIDGIEILELFLNGSTLKFNYMGSLMDCDATTISRNLYSGLKVSAL